MIINKQLKREVKKNFAIYATVFFIIVMGLGMFTSFIISADSVTEIVERVQKDANVEDGSFRLMMDLTKENEKDIEKIVNLQKSFYIDIKEKKTTYRIFQIREDMNKIQLSNGKYPKNDSELVLEEKYAQSHNVQVGDKIKIDGKKYKVSGLGFVPDYCDLLKEVSDLNLDKDFALVFMKKTEHSKIMKNSEDDVFIYSFQYKDKKKEKKLKKELEEFGLISFLPAEDNVRIRGAIDDVAVNKSIATMEGIILSILIGFVLSVFSSNLVERESVIIGTLASLGYLKKELIRHFEMIPCILTLLASIFGLLFGIFLSPMMVESSEYSYGAYEYICQPYVVVYAIAMPLIIVFIINLILLNRKLSKLPVKLLRKETKEKTGLRLKLKNLSFMKMYRFRQILKEMRISIVMFFGLVLSILVLLLGVSIYGSIHQYAENIKKEIKQEYTTTVYQPLDKKMKYVGYMDLFNKKVTEDGKEFSITMLGLEENPYFEFSKDLKGNGVYISNSVAFKFGLSKGDTLVVKNKDGKKEKFKITGVVDYSNSLYVFMNLDSMRERFEKNEDYYNVVFSNEKLDVDSSLVNSVTSKKDVVKMAETWEEGLMPIIIIMMASSILIFILMMFMMLKIMIDRSKGSISLIKIFGYNDKEVNKMYLGSAAYVVFLSVLIGVPFDSFLASKIFPMFVSDTNAGIACYISPELYVICFGIIIFSYVIGKSILVGKLKKMSFVEMLKDRE